MESNYYIEYYDLERKHWWFQVREKIILDKIKYLFNISVNAPQQLNILNVGVASGRSSEALSSLGKVTSIEYDAACCEFTRNKTGLEIIEGSILNLPFKDNTFDLVCSFDVLEHVDDDRTASKELMIKFDRANIGWNWI